METSKKHYATTVSDYLENPKTREIFCIFDTYSVDNWGSGRRTFFAASAYNLRKGEPCIITLEDLSKLQDLEPFLAAELHISGHGWDFAKPGCTALYQRDMQATLDNGEDDSLLVEAAKRLETTKDVPSRLAKNAYFQEQAKRTIPSLNNSYRFRQSTSQTPEEKKYTQKLHKAIEEIAETAVGLGITPTQLMDNVAAWLGKAPKRKDWFEATYQACVDSKKRLIDLHEEIGKRDTDVNKHLRISRNRSHK